MTHPRHLIFDLDGTLVDSAPVIVAILNDMLSERGSERRMSVAKVRPWFSWGGPALISAALQVEGDEAARELADFRERYAARRTPDECVFEGVREGLYALDAAGFTMAICSNKPTHLCEQVLDDVGLRQYFPVIVGSTLDLRQKPAPDLLKLALMRAQAHHSDALLIGDSDVDHAAAEACGVGFRLMRYGYAPEDWDSSRIVQFDTFAELVNALETAQTVAASRKAA